MVQNNQTAQSRRTTQTHRHPVPLEQLNLIDRFLFAQAMEDLDFHQTVLEIILGEEIVLLLKNQTEKELRVSPLLRAVRLDVCSMDVKQTVYDTEVQKAKRPDLPQRSRFYQSHIDTSLLEPGCAGFDGLNQTYIIMITPYDLFGLGKYRYTFRARCSEDRNCILEDGAVRIFLNTRGTNRADVGDELADFLQYVEHTDDETVRRSGSERIRKLHERIRMIKTSEEMGVKYMQAWEEKVLEREAGREEGRREGVLLAKQALKLAAEGLSAEQIADQCKVAAEEIRAILEN